MQKDKIVNTLSVKKIKDFIQKNSNFIYDYINIEILKDVGAINKGYFTKVIQEIDIKENINPNILPYYIFTLLFNEGKVDYTSLRNETLSLNQINKEASTYYNYARFSLKKDFLFLELMQCKIGGMPIDEDIIKFTKKIPINSIGLEEFIDKKAYKL